MDLKELAAKAARKKKGAVDLRALAQRTAERRAMNDGLSSLSDMTRNPTVHGADMSFAGRLKDNLVGVDDGQESVGEFVAGALNKGGQGLMFGFGDEADAAARTALGAGKPTAADLVRGDDRGAYERNLDRYRGKEADFEERHPVAAPAAEVGGALLPLMFGVGAVGNTIRGGAAVGAGQGAAFGFGNGEGGLEHRAANAAAGGLLGGLLGGAVPAVGNGIRAARNAGRTRAAISGAADGAPTSEQLRAAGNAAYQRIDDAGVQIRPEAFEQARRGLMGRLHAETGFDALPGAGSLTPNTARVAQIMEEASGRMAQEPTAALPFKSLDQMRRQAGAAAGNVTNRTDQQSGSTVIEGLDDFVQRLGPEDVIAGDTQALKQAIPEARGIWGQMRKSQMVDDAIEQEGNYLSGGASAIRNQFAKILRNPKSARGFSDAEKAALRRVVNGTPAEHLINLLGGGLGNLGQVGTGLALGGPVGALAGAATSVATRKMAEGITRKNAELARAAIASGKLKGLPTLTNDSALQRLLAQSITRGGNARLN